MLSWLSLSCSDFEGLKSLLSILFTLSSVNSGVDSTRSVRRKLLREIIREFFIWFRSSDFKKSAKLQGISLYLGLLKFHVLIYVLNVRWHRVCSENKM